MKKRVVDGTEIEAGTGNVLAELGLRDAGRLEIKSGLTSRDRQRHSRAGADPG